MGNSPLSPSRKSPVFVLVLGMTSALFGAVGLGDPTPASSKPAPIEVVDVKPHPVNFGEEVLPIFRSSCLACHNAKDAKGGLVLETPKAVRTGGDTGPAVDLKSPDQSLLLTAAAHRDKPYMPPRNNKLGALALTGQQLGLLRLWISQGAGGDDSLKTAPIAWQPLPTGLVPVLSAAISPDGKFAACGRANQIFIYDLPGKRLVTRLTDPSLQAASDQNRLGSAHRDLVQSLAFSPDGKLLASGGYREVKLWRRADPSVRTEVTDASVKTIATLARSPDGHLVAAAGDHGLIRLYDPATGISCGNFTATDAAIVSLVFSADGKRLVSASVDGALRLWDVQKRAETTRMELPSPVTAMTLLGNGSMVVAQADNSMRAWSAFSRPTRIAATANPQSVVAVSPDKKHLALFNGQKIDLFQLPGFQPAGGIEAASAKALCWDNAGKMILIASDQSLALGDPASGKILETFVPPAAPTQVALRGDSRQIALASSDGTIHLMRAQSADEKSKVRTIKSDGKPVTSLVYSRDGSTLFASSESGSIRGIGSEDGIQRFLTTPTGIGLHHLTLSPEGSVLAAAGDDKLVHYWSSAGSPLAKAQGKALPAAIGSLHFAMDGHQLLAGLVDSRATLLDVEQGGVIASLPGVGELIGLAADPGENRELVISVSADHAALRAQPLPKAKLFSAATTSITCLEPNPTQPTQFFSGGQEGAVKLWDLNNVSVVRQWDLGAPVTALAVRDDGKRLAAGGPGKFARIWNLEDGREPLNARADREALGPVQDAERKLAYANGEAAHWRAELEDANRRKQSETQSIARVEKGAARAQKTLAEATKQNDTRSAAKAEADKALADAKSADEAARAMKPELEKKHADAEKALAEAKAQADKARAVSQAAAGASPADKAKTKALAADLAVAEKTLADAMTAFQAATTARNGLDGKLSDAANKVREKESNVTQRLAALVESQAALERAQQSITSIEKARNSAKANLAKAIADIATAKTAQQAADASVAQAQAQLDAATKAAAESGTPIVSVAFSADGGTLLTGGEDGAIRAWSAETAAPVETLHGHTAPVRALATWPDGTIVSASANGSMKLWDTKGGWALQRTIGAADDSSPLAGRVECLAFSPDGSLLATGSGIPSRSGQLLLWKSGDGALAGEIKDAHSDSIMGLSFSRDGRNLASCSADKFMKVFAVANGSLVHAFEGHASHVLAVDFRYDGRMLVTGSADNLLKAWDLVDREEKKIENLPVFPLEVTSAHYVGYSNQVLLTTGDGTARLLSDVGGAARELDTGSRSYLYCSAVTPDGRLAVGGGEDGVLRVWDLREPKLLEVFPPPEPNRN